MKGRQYFNGTNTSANIGFIEVQLLGSYLEFNATPEEKSLNFGRDNTIPMSGAQYVIAESEPGLESKPGETEHFFVWGLPMVLAQEMICSYHIERTVHLTVGNGAYAVAGCLTRAPGCICCLGEETDSRSGVTPYDSSSK